VKNFAESNGITEEETWERFKKHYDGYHFSQDGEDIYNPFSVLNAFTKGRIGDYWFRSGTPSFLVKLLRRNRFPLIKLEGQLRSESQLSDITDSSRDIVPLLFQAGYLTLRGWDERRRKYLLEFPNREVYSGFWESLVDAYFPVTISSDGFDVFTLVDQLTAGSVDSFMVSIKSLISSATSEHIPDKEEHFQNMMAIICRMLGLETRTEIHSSQGRCDMTVACAGYVYIFEFKIDGSAGKALDQILERGYADPYMSDPREKILVGANFSTETRTLTDWVSERLIFPTIQNIRDKR
ncbi:MAG: AAA family ATPase, partial [Bacteroidales bacterium]|nr:AAA family ATPase [Bacteroidales bacterium]